MSRERKPLVLGDDASVQQLQRPDDIDAPLAGRVERLEQLTKALAEMLCEQHIAVPDELLD